MNRYITTTLPYVNGKPHIGFALEIIQADMLARYYRLQGDTVFFNTGTDEHGQKIWQQGGSEAGAVQKYIDTNAATFKELVTLLNISSNAFIRTTDKAHMAAAQVLWEKCAAAGDIYKKHYQGLYCIGHEAFVKENDLVDGKCPDHPNLEPQVIEEENYFFKLSKYEKELREYLSDKNVIIPEWQRQAALTFVNDGLEDFSISRSQNRMPWGVPVPGDDTQVMYVWFDALPNYISTLGWPADTDKNFKNFWEQGETLQCAGKDQVRFQSIMWQAILMSAGLPTTNQIFYHGFIISGGQKMSKSLGNVIDPIEYATTYGVDVLRYFLLRHLHSQDDSDFTKERFEETYTAHLVNGLGNLVSRVLTMVEKQAVPVPAVKLQDNWVSEAHTPYREHIKNFRFDLAMDYVFGLAEKLDGYIQQEEPYKTVKNDPDRAAAVLQHCLNELGQITALLQPAMPHTAERMRVLLEKGTKPENPLFPRLETAHE